MHLHVLHEHTSFQVTQRRNHNCWQTQSASTTSSHTLNHRETCCSKGDSPAPVTVILSLRVLGFAWVKIYEQKWFDCFWKFSSSWLSGTSSIWSNNVLSLVGRSKTKHFLFGKNFLIHSLGMLEFWIWGFLPAGVEREQSLKEQLSGEGAEDFHFCGSLHHCNYCACVSPIIESRKSTLC